jgi:hypothetical protein
MQEATHLKTSYRRTSHLILTPMYDIYSISYPDLPNSPQTCQENDFQLDKLTSPPLEPISWSSNLQPPAYHVIFSLVIGSSTNAISDTYNITNVSMHRVNETRVCLTVRHCGATLIAAGRLPIMQGMLQHLIVHNRNECVTPLMCYHCSLPIN